MIRTGQLHGCKLTLQAIEDAEAIFGPNIAIIKGKSSLDLGEQTHDDDGYKRDIDSLHVGWDPSQSDIGTSPRRT